MAVYGGLSAVFFILLMYLQQVAGYSPLEVRAGVAPRTLDHVPPLFEVRRSPPIASAPACLWAAAR